MMELVRLNSWEQLQSVKIEWAQILERNQNSNPFIEFEWVSLWMKYLGKDKNVEIIAVQKGKEYVGFFPFVKNRSVFGTIYEMIGLGQSNYMDFIIHREQVEEVMKYAFEQMMKDEPQIIFSLHGILESSPTYPILVNFIKRKKYGHTIHKVVTPYINLEKIQMDKYLDKRKKLHRLDRREKRLHLLGKVERRNCTLDEMDMIFELHDKRWKKKSDTSGFTNEAERAFYTKLFQSDEGRLKTLVDALYIEGKMIAFNYGFLCGNRYLGYVLGYDDNFESFSPGRMLEKEAIVNYVNTDITIFDLSIGYEPYKFEWSTNVDQTAKFIFSTKGIRVYCGRNLFSAREKLIELIKMNRKIVLFKRDTLGYLKYIAKKFFRSAGSTSRKVAFLQMVHKMKSFIWQRNHTFIMKKEVERPRKPGLGEGFTELQLNDAIYDKRFKNQDLKLICTKLYGGYQAYYRSGDSEDGEIVWTNRKVLRLNSIPYIKELRKNAIWLEDWKQHNLVDFCKFVNKEHLINTVLLEVKASDTMGIKMLEDNGFHIEKSATCYTKFGKKKMRVRDKQDK